MAVDSGDSDPDAYEPDDYWYPSPLPASWQLAGAWQPPAPRSAPEPPTRIDPSGPAAPVVGPTAALRGRAGGPGFSAVGEAPAGDRARSGWQVAQGVWQGSGIRWDEPGGATPRPARPAPPAHAEQAFAASTRPKEFPGVHAFFSAPVVADAPVDAEAPTRVDFAPPVYETPFATDTPSAVGETPAYDYPDPVVPGSSMATGAASERYSAWQESVREASGWPEAPAAPRRNVARNMARATLPAAVIVTVGAGAFLMLTGRATQMMKTMDATGAPRVAASSPAHRAALASPARRTVRQASVTDGPAGWLAIGKPADGKPALLTSPDGAAWHPLATPGAFNEPGLTLTAVAASGHGYVVAGWQAEGSRRFAAMWWSPDLQTWTRANNGNLDGRLAPSELYAVTATGIGFVAAGTHAGHAAVWLTGTGLSWAPLNLPLPGGATSAALRFTAARGATVVAAGDVETAHGTIPFVAMSRDDGQKWQQVGLPASGGGTVTALTASPAGFTATGQASGRPATWTSPDGITWSA